MIPKRRLLSDQQYRFGSNVSIPHVSLSPVGQRLGFVREGPRLWTLDKRQKPSRRVQFHLAALE